MNSHDPHITSTQSAFTNMNMDLSKLAKKTLGVPRGLTYTYYASPAQPSQPTLLLFHGAPDTARLWAGLINNYLLPNGYGVIAIDCLGYGGTSKPLELNAYAWDLQAADAMAILDAEALQSVISVGHDWGAAMAQHIYNFHPDRVIGLIMINVAYTSPTGNFDLDTTNALTKELFGHGCYEYWNFLQSDDAAPIMDANLESMYTLAFSDPASWPENWCTPGGFRKYLTEGRTQPTLPFTTAQHKADFMARFGAATEGFAPMTCWYKAFGPAVQNEVDRRVPEEDKVVKVPYLFWGGKGDAACRHEVLDGSVKDGLLPDCTKIVREGGHWALLERPEVFGEDVLGWLRGKFE